MDIISVPPATTRSSRPAMIDAAAMLTLVMPEPQNRSSVTPLARTSYPASRADILPRSPPCCATCALVPQMMSSTSAVSMPVRSASARNTVAPSCCGWIPDRAPLPALPMPRGVLEASMISASPMAFPQQFVVLDPLAAGTYRLSGVGGARGEAVQEMVHDHVRKISRADA